MATTYICKGCRGGTTARCRLCSSCRRELNTGLYGGRWIQRGGIWVWVEDGAA